MSRSYKKHPYSGDKKDKFLKNYANRKLRRRKIEEDDGLEFNHKSYRKNFQQYDICDWKELPLSFEQFYQRRIQIWHSYRKYYGYSKPTREESYKLYIKWYKRK